MRLAVEIPLHSRKYPGRVAIVDDEDAAMVSALRWNLIFHQGERIYAISNSATGSVLMHRLLMQCQDGLEVDHRNGDGLDNRRENLRVCTHAENMQNRAQHRNNTSGVTGVYWHRHRNKWAVQLRVNGKKVSLGHFSEMEEAKRVRDDAARRYHGEFARLNTA